jgi:hypothetical protein
VEGRWDSQQSFANDEEEKPREQECRTALRQPENFCKPRALRDRRSHQFLQAGRADDPVIVLGDAFATEKPSAFRAARHRLTHRVIETTLVKQALHGQEIKGGISPTGAVAAMGAGAASCLRAAVSSPVSWPCAAMISGRIRFITFLVFRSRQSENSFSV